MPPHIHAGDDRVFLIVALFGGLVLRLGWFIDFKGNLANFAGSGEATRVALAIARTGRFAGAYYEGYGPTAHLLPVNPMIAGGITALFGASSPASNIALLIWSLAQSFLAILLLRKLFPRLGFDRVAVRWGTVLLCLITPFVPQETVDFRYWEGATAVCLVAANLLVLTHVADRRDMPWPTMLAIAGLSALTFFICPPAGLAIDLCWAIYALRRLRRAQAIAFAISSAAALALLVTPWAIRNERVLGSPVLLRSDFGLELAMANNPAVLSDLPPERVFADNLLRLHPFQSVPARAVLARAGGEVAYSRMLGHQARQWIAAHPAAFARLCLRHLREFFFPEAWQMYFTGWEGMRAPRAIVITLVNLLGLAGLATGLWQRRNGFAPLALYVVVTALPYMLVQPIQRYIYLVYDILAFVAVDTLVRLARYASGSIPGAGCPR